MIQSFEVLIDAGELLKAIWYSDGSGAYGTCGVGIDDTPDRFELIGVRLVGDRVALSLRRRPEPGDAEVAG